MKMAWLVTQSCIKNITVTDRQFDFLVAYFKLTNCGLMIQANKFLTLNQLEYNCVYNDVPQGDYDNTVIYTHNLRAYNSPDLYKGED